MINWKVTTRDLFEGLKTTETSVIILRRPDGRGSWVISGPTHAFEEWSLKDLRSWLWGQRVCRLFKRPNGLSVWAALEDGRTVVGFAEFVEEDTAARWIRMGGPAL